MSEQQQTLTIQQVIDLAVQHHNAGRLPEAESIYQQILQTNPDQPVALHLLGVIAHQTGKNDIAVDFITKALAIKPDLAEAHSNLGLALQDLGKSEDAISSYRKALALKPDYAEAHNNLGKALKDLGQLDEAVVSCNNALALKPDYAEAHNNLGATFRELRQLDEAVTHFNRALEIKPNYIDAYDNRGHAIDLQRGKKPFDHEAALDQCLSAISQDNFDDATAILHHVCLNSPYKTPTFIKQFIDACCEAITRMLDNRNFDVAGNRIRRLFMLIEDHKPFDVVMQRYVDETKNQTILETLDTHENSVYLSMQSRVFYQNGQYDEAERCARQCIENTKVLLESETQRNDGWFLVRKNLNNIKDSEKARVILEELLLGIEI